MATLNTGLWVAGFDLAPGQQHHWIQDGQTFGKVRWFMAHPILFWAWRAKLRLSGSLTSLGPMELGVSTSSSAI